MFYLFCCSNSVDEPVFLMTSSHHTKSYSSSDFDHLITSQKLRRLVNLPFVSSEVNTSPVEKQGHIFNHLLCLELNLWISPMGVMTLLKNLGKKWKTNLFTSSYSFSNFLYKLLKSWEFFHNTFFFQNLNYPRFPFLKLWSVLWHTFNFVT